MSKDSKRTKKLILAAAKQAGATDPELVYRSVVKRLETGKDGVPTGIEQAIADEQVRAPHLFDAPPGDGQSGRSSTAGNDWIRAQARRSTVPDGVTPQGMNDWIRKQAGR